MRSYAQTNIQLFNQLRGEGYSQNDTALVRDAYELTMSLYSARFTLSGRPFIAHLVGPASVLAALRFPAQAVAAALLHNAYQSGDFGDGSCGISPSRRRKLRRAVGPEVEEYVARFPALYWQPRVTQTARRDPKELDSVDRTVLVILFAEHLDHLLHCDVLYYDKTAIDFYVSHSRIAAEIADRFQLCSLAAELREAIYALDSAELPVEPSLNKVLNDRLLVPVSCRKRFSVAARQTLIRARQRLRLVNRRRLNVIRRCAPQAYANASKKWRRSASNGLEKRSENFAALFAEHATVERVATGFQFTEGPVWLEEERSLLFSDIPANRIYRLAADGRVMTVREPSGNSNGLTRDKEGRLIACEHGNRRVTRTEKDGSVTPLADRFHGKKLNSPNDVVVKSDGAIYFTDPAYGITPDQQEQPIEGVYRLCPDGKEISLVANDLARPNGLAFSPDEKRLYIDDSERRHIRVYVVRDDGSLSGGSLFHDMNVNTPGAPDGMKVDVDGRVYCTGAGGVWVFDDAGKHLGTIVTPEKPSNCAWGDDDWRSLYITAVTSVYRIRVKTPGIKVA